MAKFLSRLFNRGSSLRGSRGSLDDHAGRTTQPATSLRPSASLENLASYHIVPKQLKKNKLHQASWDGDLNRVRKLALPGQINLKDEQNRTALHLAVVKGNLGVVQHLIQENAKLDAVDNDQRTPLIKAVLSGAQNPQRNYEICATLLEGGADESINVLDKSGKNALHYAIDFDKDDLVDLICANDKCDPNVQDRDQMSPLHLAIKRKSSRLVKALLSRPQVDPNRVNRYGQTPLHMAASVGYTEIVRILLGSDLDDPCDPTIRDSQQLTAYQVAKANHQEACATLILEFQDNRLPETTKSQSLNEPPSTKAISSLSIQPAANVRRRDDQTSDDSSYPTVSQPKKRAPARPTDRWSDSDSSSIDAPKPPTSHLASLVKQNPLRAEKPTSLFGIGPLVERHDSDSTPMSVSPLGHPQRATNPYAKVVAPDPKSWSDDTITAVLPKKSPVVKAKDTWDSASIDLSDDDTDVLKSPVLASTLQRTQPFSSAPKPRHDSKSDDDDDDSIEKEMRRLDMETKKISSTGYKIIGPNEPAAAVSEQSSWTDSPSHVLVQQQPLTARKSSESTWDDSRPPSVAKSPGIESLVSAASERPDSVASQKRHRETEGELKRQLEQMEKKMKKFEELSQQNDRLLRETESKLQQEKNEKQRLESTTKHLTVELKQVRGRLQSLEDEKDSLDQRVRKLKEERDTHDEKLRALQARSIPPSAAFIGEDVNTMKSRHREEMKSLSAENDHLHDRSKELQSDLELHRDSLDVAVRYKMDLEKALEDKAFFQREFDRMKEEKDRLDQEKFEFKCKYDSLQDEIRKILLDRSKLEQQLTSEVQEQIHERQRSKEDVQKYKAQVERVNMQLTDAQQRLSTLEGQNQSLLSTKDRQMTSNLETVTQQYLNQSIPSLSKAASLPVQSENYLVENSRQIRSDTERLKTELDRLRSDFYKLVSNYEPMHQQPQLHSHIDMFRSFYEKEFRQRQTLMGPYRSHPTSPLVSRSTYDEPTNPLPPVPRQASALLTINTLHNGFVSSIELLR